MSNQVKVEDLEVFSLFRVAILKFAQAADQSLANADSQIGRTHSWLETEQMLYWQNQLRKRTEAVTKARDAVRQKKLYKDSTGHTRNASDEEKILAQCVAAVEQAQRKIETVRKWLPRLEKAGDLYRSGVSRLNRTVGDDIPRAVALLDRLAASLEQYMQIESPAGSMSESSAATPFDESMSRGGDAAAEPPPNAIVPVDQATAIPAAIPSETEAPMSLNDSKGILSKAAKDLFARWNDVKAVWSDAQSQEFEKTYLLPLEQDVRSAMGALDNMNQVLETLKSDCE